MKIGIAFANAGPLSDPTLAVTTACAAEAAGFESLWTVEHVLVPKGYETFLVEHYRPGTPVEGLRSSAALVRDAAAAMGSEGKSVRFVRSTIVPGDESLFCLFEAVSEELVREAYLRAAVEFERISTAISE